MGNVLYSTFLAHWHPGESRSRLDEGGLTKVCEFSSVSTYVSTHSQDPVSMKQKGRGDILHSHGLKLP